MADEKKYITELDLVKAQQELERKFERKVDSVDRKVDTLNNIILPLVESSKQTAENTDRIANNLDDFMKDQRNINNDFHSKLHGQELKISRLDLDRDAKVEENKNKATIMVAVITALGGLILGLINLAPTLFG